jgi:hypothetical protein
MIENNLNIVICPICRGKGLVVDKLISFFTLGLSLLDEPNHLSHNKCTKCKGVGYVDLDMIGKAIANLKKSRK